MLWWITVELEINLAYHFYVTSWCTKNKDISSIPAIKWGLKHEATALSADLKKFEETDKAVEVVKPGLLTHIKYSYTRASPDAIISCNCHGFNIIEIKCLLDVKLVSI